MMRSRRDGFALMAALWLVVLIGLTGYELSLHSHLQRLSIANALERSQGVAAADAGLRTARALLENRLARVLSLATPAEQQSYDPWVDVQRFAPDTTALGGERFVLRMFDAGSRLQINRATEDDWRRFFTGLRLDANAADRLAQRIMDWRDADEFRRAHGAERAEYLQAGARRLPSNMDFAAVGELKDVDGITPDLYNRIRENLTTLGTGQINVNSAGENVLRSLPGLGDETIAMILSMQRNRVLVHSWQDLSPRLSSGARSALNEAASELLQRASFAAVEVVAESEGWEEGSPVHVHGEALFARGGDALFTVWQRIAR